MKRSWFFGLLVWALALGAVFSTVPARAELRVVATTGDLAALAQAIGKERVTVKSLALPSQDPHWVDARPNLALELSNADLLLAVGSGLEVGWLPTLQLGARNPKIQRGGRGYVECSAFVDMLEVPTAKVDRSMGDIHPGGNPHYMFDPRAAERVAVGIGKRMAELDPEGRARYLANTKEFLEELRKARVGWEEALRGVHGKKVVAYHRSLAYLADWLGLVVIDQLEPKPGIPPNPQHVAEVIRRAREEGARSIIQEVFYPSSTSELVAKKLEGKLIRVPGATNFPSGQSYIAFLDQIVKLLVGMP